MTEEQTAEAPVAPAAIPPAPQNFGDRFGVPALMQHARWLRFGLIIRLGVFYFIFCHNRGSGLDHRRNTILGTAPTFLYASYRYSYTVAYTGVMVVVYFLQVGLFKFLYLRLLQSLVRPSLFFLFLTSTDVLLYF